MNLLYHPATRTLYRSDECPYPQQECRAPMLEDLSAALLLWGAEVLTVQCNPHARGHVILLEGRHKRCEIMIPDETLRAAMSIAQAFDGAVVQEDVDQILEKINAQHG